MVNCFRCVKEFRGFFELKRHLNKLKLCKANYLIIDPNMIIKQYDEIYKIFIKARKKSIVINVLDYSNPDYNSQIANIEKDNSKDMIIKTCEFCGNGFKHKNSYYRHKREKRCSVLKQEIMKNEIDEKQKEIDKLTEIIEKNNNQLDEENEKEKIVINDYRNENTGFMLPSIHMYRIVKSDLDMVVTSILIVHIEEETNRNIFINDTKSKYAMILKDQKWVPIERLKLIEDICNRHIGLIDQIAQKTVLKEKKIFIEKRLVRFTEKEDWKEIKTDVELLLLTNRDLIRETYENNYGKKIKMV